MKAKSLLATIALAGAGAALAARARKNQEPYSFAGSVVLIAGGSRGLGLVLGRMLAEEGARIAVLGRDRHDLDRAVEDIRAHGGEAMAIDADVGDERRAQEAVRQVIDRWDRLDVLLNVAGIIQVGPWEHMSVGDYEEAMAVHMWGPLYTMLAAIPQMRKQGEGRIVNISSIGGKIAVPHLLPYCASKHALVGLSDGMRAELARDNIHVTTVAPGLMRTGSPVNAFFKGHQESEYAWFVTLGSLPFTSIGAEEAARQIVEATRNKDPELTITVQARLAIVASTLFPGLFARAMQLTNLLLPKATGPDGDRLQTGWESRTAVSTTPLAEPTYQAAEQHNQLGA